MFVSLYFSSVLVSVIRLEFRTKIPLNVTVIRRTSGRILGTVKQRHVLSDVRNCGADNTLCRKLEFVVCLCVSLLYKTAR
jgi:hypothetical protein